MPYVTNEGAEIHYHLEQEISGPSLATHRSVMILSHGFMMDTTCWYKHGYVQELKKNFDLLIVDARGHGLSSKPHTPAEYEDKTMARDVLAVMDDADVKTASFFGFSMGGRTGLELAYIEPRRFNFFVIASATPGPRTEVGIKSDIRRIKSFSQGKVAVASFMDRIGAEMDPYRKEAIEGDLKAYLAKTKKNIERLDITPLLKNLDVPCLMYAGGADPLSHESAKDAARFIPSAEFHTIPDLKHMHTFGRTDLIFPLVRNFLERNT
jgi:pimeloyl-ACP methyl ester carboxylesterase